MRRIRPDAVMIELCAFREHNLYADDDRCEFRAAFLEAQNLRDCRVVLGDRDYRITDKRAWNVVGFLQVCRFVKYSLWLMLADLPRALIALSLPVFRDDEATQRESYVVGNRLLAEMYPELWKANMTERDLYMTHVLHDWLESLTQKKFRAARREGSTKVLHDPKPVRIVAVVGADQVDGIKANWGKRVDPAVIE
ncbi:TraB family protein [Aphelenchoides avenae]|nr:TraB family protein [Aphelenchus avenae]